MSERKPVSKKLRFEVFKRDAFICQYCGKKAPDVILHVDHIEPVSKGGGNDVLNLITACGDCNLGKGARELSDDSEVQKQRRQLEELNERREQLEAMLAWREGLKGLDADTLDSLCDEWNSLICPCEINETGRASLKKLLRKFGHATVMDAIDKAAERYVKHDADGCPTLDSVNNAFRKIGGICYFLANPDKRDEKDLYYIRGILRNRLNYVNEGMCIGLLRRAREANVDLESVKDIAKSCRSWTAFREAIEAYLDEYEVIE